MVENGNVGLGEAISGGTNLSGNWGNPLSQGLGLRQRNVLLEAQQEAQRQAKEQAQIEKIGKYSAIDTSKWRSPSRANAHKLVLDKYNNDIMQAVMSGDMSKAAMKRQEAIGLTQAAKANDEQVYELAEKPVKGSISRQYIKSLYPKGGVEALVKDHEELPFRRLVDVSEDGLDVRAIDVEDPKITKTFRNTADFFLSKTPTTKKVATGGGQIYYEVDPKDPTYQANKATAINSIFNDDAYVKQLAYTPDFEKYYRTYLAKNGKDVYSADLQVDEYGDAEIVVGEDGLPKDDYGKAMYGFIKEKFDENERPIIKDVTPKSSGGSGRSKELYVNGRNTPWDFRKTSDGGTIMQSHGTGATTLSLKGIAKVGEKGKQRNVEAQEVKNAVAKWRPEDRNFIVTGADEGGLPITMLVGEDDFIANTGLTDSGVEEYFTGYKRKGSVKTEKPTTKKKRVYAGLDASGNPIYKEE